MIDVAFAAGVPALLGSAGGTAGFDATTVIGNMITSAETQLYAIIGIVAPIMGAITVAIVLVKNGSKWIRRLGSA